MQDVFSLIAEYEKDYNDVPIKVVDGYEFDQAETLKRISLYANGQFLDGSSDSMGEKVFFDITTPTVRNAAKNIDLDTKDIQFRAVNGSANYFVSWLYRRRAKEWMRESGLARKLNTIPEKVSGYGTVVVKRIRGKEVFRFVDLRNLACDASAPSLKDGWVSERHFYTPSELINEAKSRGWDVAAAEAAAQDFLVHRQENYVGEEQTISRIRGNCQYICVHEFTGHMLKSQFTGEEEENDEQVLASVIVVLPEDKGKQTGNKQMAKGLILFKTEVQEIEYKELHYRKVDGRWLGRGLYEECFPMQETENTRSNWMLMAMRLSQLIVFQTREATALQNVLTDLENGSIAKFAVDKRGDMLSRLDTTAKDNGSSQLLSNTIKTTMQGLTNSYEVTTGANLPSGTPFSLGNMMNQNANKLFEFIREDYGLFLEEIFNDWVMPELERDMNLEGVLEIIDKDELEYVKEHFAKWKVWDSVKKTLLSGITPTKLQVQIVQEFVESQLEDQNSLAIEIPKGFLSYEKRVHCVVTDESESPAMMQSLTTVLQMASQNPAVIEMPAFNRILDMIGLHKADIMPLTQPQTAPAAPAAPQALAPA